MAAPRTKRRREEEEKGENEAPAQTRARVSRACDECRRRKDRCDGQEPSCGPCSIAGRVCTYNPNKKRGLRSGYVRSLEMLLGLLFSAVDGSEAWVSSVLEGEPTKPALRLKNFEGYEIDGNVDVAELFTQTWRSSTVSKRLELLLSPRESVEDDDESYGAFSEKLAQAFQKLVSIKEARSPIGEGEYRSSDTAMETIIVSPQRHRIGTSAHAVPWEGTRVSNKTPVPTQSAQPQPHPPGVNLSSPFSPCVPSAPLGNALGMPSDWPHLVDIYLSTTHCWLPICQKHDLLRMAHTLANSTENQPNTPDFPHAGDRAFICAVLAHALYQDAIHAGQDRTRLSPTFTALAEKAAGCVSVCDGRGFSIGHVRALTVVALLEAVRGRWARAWVTIGQAVYVSTSLNVVGATARHGASPLDEGAKRAILGCITMETLIAARFKQRPYFNCAAISSIGPLQSEGIEEWESSQPYPGPAAPTSRFFSGNAPARVLSIYSNFIELVRALNDFLTRPEDEMYHDSVRKIECRLDACDETLPSHCRLSADAGLSLQQLNLHIAFASIHEFITPRRSALDTGAAADSAALSRVYVRQLRSILDARLSNTWAQPVLPLVPVYLCLLDGSFQRQNGILEEPAPREEERLLSHTLRQLRHLQLSTCYSSESAEHASPNMSTSKLQHQQPQMHVERSNPSASDATASAFTPSSVSHASRPSIISPSTAAYSIPSSQFNVGLMGNANGALGQLPAENDGGSLSPTRGHSTDVDMLLDPGLPPDISRQPLHARTAGALDPPGTSNAPEPLESEPFLNSLPSEVGGDQLFDSLATLDSSDW